MAEDYQSKAALRSPPHITLHMPFRLSERKLVNLDQVLGHFASRQKPFEVKLKDFNAFPPRVVFIEVVPSRQLVELQKNLTSSMSSSMKIFNSNYKARAFHPHVTIAFRDLKKAAFQVAWHFYNLQTFDAGFTVEAISLLKHNGQLWKPWKHYKFG